MWIYCHRSLWRNRLCIVQLKVDPPGSMKHNNWTILGSTDIKPDQLDPWIKDQLGNVLLSTILPLRLQNFVSCGRACPCRGEIVDKRVIFSWSMINGSSWSGLIKVTFGCWGMDSLWSLGQKSNDIICLKMLFKIVLLIIIVLYLFIFVLMLP